MATFKEMAVRWKLVVPAILAVIAGCCYYWALEDLDSSEAYRQGLRSGYSEGCIKQLDAQIAFEQSVGAPSHPELELGRRDECHKLAEDRAGEAKFSDYTDAMVKQFLFLSLLVVGVYLAIVRPWSHAGGNRTDG